MLNRSDGVVELKRRFVHIADGERLLDPCEGVINNRGWCTLMCVIPGSREGRFVVFRVLCDGDGCRQQDAWPAEEEDDDV